MDGLERLEFSREDGEVRASSTVICLEAGGFSGGELVMPLDNYGFSNRFGWAADRFGVSWQLNLA